MRLLFAGTPEVAVPSLQALLASRHEVMAVLTRPDAPAGRGRTLMPSPVRVVAEAHGVEVLTPERPRDPEFLSRLRALAPDCAPVVAYGGLVPADALGIPRFGWVNLHFSLLPAWRGAAPVQHALLHGDDVLGACTFQLEEGLDTGPVFGTVTELARPTDTSGDVLDRLSRSGASLLVHTLDALEDGTAVAIPQGSEGISHAPKLTVEDAHIDWSHPALAIDRRIRACTPAPGAWCPVGEQRLKLGPVRLKPDVTDLAPAQIRITRSEVLIGTGSHAVALGLVQPAGKRPMAATDWARGARVGDHLR